MGKIAFFVLFLAAAPALAFKFDLAKENQILETGRAWWTAHPPAEPVSTAGMIPYTGAYRGPFEFLAAKAFPGGRVPQIYSCDFPHSANPSPQVMMLKSVCQSGFPFGVWNEDIMVPRQFVVRVKEKFRPVEAAEVLNFVAAHELCHFVQNSNYYAAPDKSDFLIPANSDFFVSVNTSAFYRSHAEVDVLAILLLHKLGYSIEGARLALNWFDGLPYPGVKEEIDARMADLRDTFPGF